MSFTTPSATPPGPVQNVQFVSATGGRISITWDPPVDTGGVPIASYRVQLRNTATGGAVAKYWHEAVAASGMPVASTSVDIEALLAASTYSIRVAAINDAGEQALPGTVSGVVGATVLTTTANLLAANPAPSTGSAIVVEFTPVGASATTVVVLTIGDMNFASATLVPLQQPLSRAIPAGATIKLTGQLSTALTASTTAPTVPATAPSPVMLNATGGAIKVSLDAPLDTGGVPVLMYDVMLRVAGSSDSYVSSGVMLEGAQVVDWIPHLDPTTSYEFVSVAKNLMSSCSDDAFPSDPTTVTTTIATVPTPPLGIALTGTTGGIVSIEWRPPVDDGGVDVTAFTVQLSTDDLTNDPQGASATWTPVLTADTLDHTQYGLTASTDTTASVASFRVQAVNSVGSSPHSVVFSHTMSGPTLPSVPLDLAAHNITGGAARLTWSKPLDGGGLPLVQYVAGPSQADAACVVAC